MKLVVNTTGTHVHKGQLKTRLDCIAAPGEKSYAQNCVLVPVIPPEGYPGKVDEMGNPVDQKDYDLWMAGLPHIWQLNPSLCLFVRIDENTSKELLTEWAGDVLTKDRLATIDDIMSRTGLHESAHLISPYMKDKETLSTAKTLTFDEAAKTAINTRLSGLVIVGENGGTIERVEPKSIDIGSAAIDRANSHGYRDYTFINHNNSANATGTLDTFQIYINNYDGTNAKAGTWYLGSAAEKYSNRDYDSIGTITYGSAQTFTGLTISVTAGDFLGCFYSGSGANPVEAVTSGGSGSFYASGDKFGKTDTIFNIASYADDIDSIYGTGTESGGGGWTTIGKVNGVASANIGKVNGVAKASIAKINGTAV